jgi:hypothetical protein
MWSTHAVDKKIPLAAPKFQRTGALSQDLPQVDYTAFAGAGAAHIANTLAGSAAEIGKWADEATVAEAQKEGARDGLDPEFRPSADNTLRARAYNATAIRIFAENLDVDTTAKADAIALDKGHDPKALSEGLDKLRDGVLSTLFDEAKPEFEQRFARLRLGYERDAARNVFKATQEASGAALQSMIADRSRAIEHMGFTLGLDATADATLQNELTDFEGRLLSYGPKEGFTYGGKEYAPDAMRAGVLGLDKIATLSAGAKTTVAAARLRGAFERLPGVAAKERYLDQFLKDYDTGKGVAQLFDLDQRDSMVSTMRGEIGRLRVEEHARLGYTRRRAKEALDGEDMDPDELDGLIKDARFSGDPALAADGDQLAVMVPTIRGWAQLKPAELQQELSRLRGIKGGPGKEDKRISAGDTLLGKMNAGLARDPISWAARAGLVRVEPIDTSTPNGFVASLKRRAPQAVGVGEYYGQAVKYFTDEEAEALASLHHDDPQRAATLAGNIMRALGPNEGKRAIAQIAPKDPTFAHVAALQVQGGAARFVPDAAAGKALRNAPGFKARVEWDDVHDTADAMFEDVFRLNPVVGNTARALAYDAANARLARDPGLDKKAAVKAALSEAVGGVSRNGVSFGGVGPGVNGVKTLVPNWIKTDRLGYVVANMTPYDFTRAGGEIAKWADGKTPVPPVVMRSARLVPIGSGRYYLQTNRAGKPTYIPGGGPGGFFVLDLNKIRPDLAKRHAGVVMP